MAEDFQIPLILAAVSLAGTIITSVVTAYITYFSEEHKARRDANKILLKYRDPLLMSATDLQARCWGICEQDLLDFKDFDQEGEEMYNDALFIYTAYVVGQYLSWVWILRRQAQFVALVSSSVPKWHLFGRNNQNNASSLTQKMDAIRTAFNKDRYRGEKAFLLFKSHQQTIGEIMSCQDAQSGEYYCMGYATFTERWRRGALTSDDSHSVHKAGSTVGDQKMAGISNISDQAFRKHFKSIEDGIHHMYAERKRWKKRHPDRPASNGGSDNRLRRLQHLLLDLMAHLDDSGTMANGNESSPTHAAPDCDCSLKPCHCNRGCNTCIRQKNSFFGRSRVATHCDCEKCEGPKHNRRHTHVTASEISQAAPEQFTDSKDAVVGAVNYTTSHDRNGEHV